MDQQFLAFGTLDPKSLAALDSVPDPSVQYLGITLVVFARFTSTPWGPSDFVRSQ
jgi:hypothetical protein